MKTIPETKAKTVRRVGPRGSTQLAMDLNRARNDQIITIDTDEDSQVDN